MKIRKLTTPSPQEPFEYTVQIHWEDYQLSRRRRNQTILRNIDRLGIDRKDIAYRYDIVIDATVVHFKNKVDGVDFYVTMGM